MLSVITASTWSTVIWIAQVCGACYTHYLNTKYRHLLVWSPSYGSTAKHKLLTVSNTLSWIDGVVVNLYVLVVLFSLFERSLVVCWDCLQVSKLSRTYVMFKFGNYTSEGTGCCYNTASTTFTINVHLPVIV